MLHLPLAHQRIEHDVGKPAQEGIPRQEGTNAVWMGECVGMALARSLEAVVRQVCAALVPSPAYINAAATIGSIEI